VFFYLVVLSNLHRYDLLCTGPALLTVGKLATFRNIFLAGGISTFIVHPEYVIKAVNEKKFEVPLKNTTTAASPSSKSSV
jgi:hypothetical protein